MRIGQLCGECYGKYKRKEVSLLKVFKWRPADHLPELTTEHELAQLRLDQAREDLFADPYSKQKQLNLRSAKWDLANYQHKVFEARRYHITHPSSEPSLALKVLEEMRRMTPGEFKIRRSSK